jgi:hypothetical protein
MRHWCASRQQHEAVCLSRQEIGCSFRAAESGFHYRDWYSFIRLYRQYLLPHLEFAGQSWSPWTAKDEEVLERVQRRVIRTALQSIGYEERLKKLDMQTLEECRHQTHKLQVYNILQGCDNIKVDQWFKMAVDGGQRTRQATGVLHLIKPRVQLNLRANVFSVRVWIAGMSYLI